MAFTLISKVDGVTLKYPPSTFSYGLQDVSDPQSGRTLDAEMHKNRVAQKVKLSLSWNVLRPNEISEVMKMFDPEYITVDYWDAKEGKVVSKEFYSGDKTSAVKYWTTDNKMFTQLSFNIIER